MECDNMEGEQHSKGLKSENSSDRGAEAFKDSQPG